MTRSAVSRYVLGSGALAVGAALAALPFAPDERAVLGWAALGWSVGAIAGTVGGAWLASLHGNPGPSFHVTFVGWMAARLLAYAAGAGIAATSGLDAVGGFVVGAALAHVPTHGFEWVWFARHGARAGGGEMRH